MEKMIGNLKGQAAIESAKKTPSASSRARCLMHFAPAKCTTARVLAGQAAMEYLMTYGWALLVIVIVIGILLVMNPFSAPQGCRFDQIGFTCDNPVLSSDPATSGYLYMTITNGNNNAIRLYKVACIQDKSNSPPAGMAVSQAEKDSPLDTLQRQDSYQLNNDTAHPIFCTKADGKTKIVVQRGTEFSGKVWIFYNNEEDGTNYPVRSAAANVVTKAV